MISLVPLKLICTESNIVYWKNPRPSSTRFCRPIRFLYAKETPCLIKEQIELIRSEIAVLSQTDIGKGVNVSHKLILSMIDGKVCNAITDNLFAMRCYTCKAAPKEMNNISEVLNEIPNTNFYDFGLSTLHAWIKCFECLLHISYNLEFRK